MKRVWFLIYFTSTALWAQMPPTEDFRYGFQADRKLASSPEVTAENGFKNDSELSLVIAKGATDAQTVNFKQYNSYRWELNMLSARYHYLRTEALGVESGRNWDFTLRYDRDITEHFGVYLAQGFQSDPYAGYESRVNSEVGEKYFLIRSDPFYWLTEAGYRYTADKRTSGPDQFSHFGRLYTEVSHKWTETASTKLWLEYLPNFSHNEEYFIHSELSVSVVINTILSLKTAYLYSYNNSPPAPIVAHSSTLLTTGLVAKF